MTLIREVLSGCTNPRIIAVKMPGIPVLHQLLIEESIYRVAESNCNTGWLLLNDFTEQTQQNARYRTSVQKLSQSPSSIVLGISSNPLTHVDLKQAELESVQLIRRFTGGGTVLINSGCFNISIIMPRRFFGFAQTPRSLMEWSGRFYSKIFGPAFSCRDNDYTWNAERKVGGNAQAFGKNLIVHHTSFLWSVNHAQMARLLKLPEKQPAYRNNREHRNFVCGKKSVGKKS